MADALIISVAREGDRGRMVAVVPMTSRKFPFTVKDLRVDGEPVDLVVSIGGKDDV